MFSAETVLAIIIFILAVICAVISVRSFAEKGFLFNNAYIWASKSEREKMDKKPHYRQTAIVFCLLCGVFLVLCAALIFQNDRIELLEIPLIVSATVYAIVSSVRIEKMKK